MRAQIALVAMVMTIGAARAECTKPPTAKSEATCVALTEALLVGLEHASSAQVKDTLKAGGIARTENGKTILYFVSHADAFGGDMNFEFDHDRVDRIFGYVNNPGGHAMEFTWNPAHRGADGNGGIWTGTCSDFPKSRFPKCHS